VHIANNSSGSRQTLCILQGNCWYVCQTENVSNVRVDAGTSGGTSSIHISVEQTVMSQLINSLKSNHTHIHTLQYDAQNEAHPSFVADF